MHFEYLTLFVLYCNDPVLPGGQACRETAAITVLMTRGWNTNASRTFEEHFEELLRDMRTAKSRHRLLLTAYI